MNRKLDGCPTFAQAYVGRKRRATRISCHGAPPTSACAAFIKESRMDFANANKVYRKSGGSPTNAFTEDTPGTATALPFVIPSPPEFTADRSHHFSASAPVVLKIVGWIDERDKDLSKAADHE